MQVINTSFSKCIRHQTQKKKGEINIEVRYFQSEGDNHVIEAIEDSKCSLCFIENESKNREKSAQNKYCYRLAMNKISISTPSSYDELQQLLAVAIPQNYGPVIIESESGDIISPQTCTFNDGETIIFREIRPSRESDFDYRHYRKQWGI
jgi:hypothetical protein